jgi:hypothetical protein
MKIQLSECDLRAAKQNWNILANRNNRSKNYCIPSSVEEYLKCDKFTTRLKINSQEWFLLENAITAFNEIFNRIHSTSELKGVVSCETVYIALKRELEAEIANRGKDPKCKRDFNDALESIQHYIDDKVNYFDFYFAVEGLKLEDIEKISYDKVQISDFNQELCDQIVAAFFGEIDSVNPEQLLLKQDFFKNYFLNRLCIRFTIYGDCDTANKKAHRQARELVNYFRYIICLLMHDRISEHIARINFAFETHGNNEVVLVKEFKTNAISIVYGRRRKPLQTFSIDKNRLEDLSLNCFMNDFFEILNATSQTQLEGYILTAIYWIGEAQNEFDLDISFLRYWTALECIFTRNKKCDITKKLSISVATLNTFGGYSFIRIEDAKNACKNITNLYKKRSLIIHRGMNYLTNQVINEADITSICKYTACSILNLFYLRSIGYTSMYEVDDQINRLSQLIGL